MKINGVLRSVVHKKLLFGLVAGFVVLAGACLLLFVIKWHKKVPAKPDQSVLTHPAYNMPDFYVTNEDTKGTGLPSGGTAGGSPGTSTVPQTPQRYPINEWGIALQSSASNPVSLKRYTLQNNNSVQLFTAAYEELKSSSGDASAFEACFLEQVTMQRINIKDVSNDIHTTPWYKNKAELDYNGTAKVGDYYYYFDTPKQACTNKHISNIPEVYRVLLTERQLIIKAVVAK